MNHVFLQYKKAHHRQPILRSTLCSHEGLSQGFAVRQQHPCNFLSLESKILVLHFLKKHLPLLGALLRLQSNSYIKIEGLVAIKML